jgi:phosphopantothenoylcysteine decarboxylase/phosphopantothenate--cysteine ligase
MHTEMWLHPATVANAETLRSRGVRLVGPVDGRLTGADSGPGRLAEPEQIAMAVYAELARPLCRDLVGRHVVITAGGTREALDPVRFLGNRSSGKQGAALAAAAVARGARVTLIHGAIDTSIPVGVEALACTSATQMHDLVVAHGADADVLVMAAAVADFRPTAPADHKIKKSGADLTITAEPTIDILRDAVERRGPGHSPVIVGFAAETGDADGDVLAHARRKLASKGCDLLVVNDVRGDRAFGSDDNEVVLLTATDHRDVPRADKVRIAHAVWDRVGDLVADRG